MDPAASRKSFVAIDLGAQSCRISLLSWNRDEPVIVEIYRFPNAPVQTNEGLRWDIEGIFASVMKGLRECAASAPEGIASIAVDGWAVDYVRLDESGDPIGLPFCYRDPRTEEAESRAHKLLSPPQLYSLTGIQIARFNTVYQLYADKLADCDPATPWINLPEFITYRLCGKRVSEYTNATHTGLVQLGTHQWCGEIFRELGLNISAAPTIVPTGSVLSPVSNELTSLPAFREMQVIAAACHDTASAIAAIPAVGDDWAFISSGTWSLVGTVLDSPCVNDDARAGNFTNLGGAGGQICFLKNVNGMWLLQQCIEEWKQHGNRRSFADLLSSCASAPPPPALIDVDEPQLMVPGNTIQKINAQMERKGQPAFAMDGAALTSLANTILHSMAARYAEVLSLISKATGRKFKRLFIVGGGSRNAVLNRLTAQRTGLKVILGATESSTIGNFAVQLATHERDWTPSRGVTAESVAKWAKALMATLPVG